MANEQKMAFASATTVISLTSTTADNEVVGGQTELDNSTNLYPMATATLEITDTFTAAPDGTIDLYVVRGDVDGTSDDTALGYAALTTTDNQTDPEYAELLGQFFADVDEAYRKTITVSLLGIKKGKFYIHNNTGTDLVYTSNAVTVKIAPFTIGT